MQIHHDDVRVQRPPHKLHRLLAVLRLADNLDREGVGVPAEPVGATPRWPVFQLIAVSRAFRLRLALGW